MSYAATLPYTTGFEANGTGDSAGQSYTGSPAGTALVGQNAWAYVGGQGTSPANVITTGAIDGSQSVKLSTVGTAGGAAPGLATTIFTDVYKADLTAALTAGSDLNISFDLNTALGTNGTHGAQAGVEVLDSTTNNVVASMFVANEGNGTPDLTISNGNNGTKDVPGYATAGDGNTGRYTLSVDPNTGQFAVLYGGQAVTSGTFPGELGKSVLISFATIDQGGAAESATFDNLSISSVVPEPASVGMIGLGTLMLLLKRPNKRIA
jgi:hypothetical protein